MKKVLFCIFLFVQTNGYSQGGLWAWMGGDSINFNPVFGTQGVPSPLNTPAGAYEATQWDDLQGNVWLFAGLSNNSSSSNLWKFDMQLYQWIWVKGSGNNPSQEVFGTKGVPSALNWPGGSTSMYSVASWTDLAGNFWLIQYDKPALWKYDVSIGQWAWMSGDTIANAPPVFGIQGVPSPLNTPGCRAEHNNCWTDNAGNLWLFGGWVYGSYFSDTWKYDVVTNEWTWMHGPNIPGQASSHGIKGVSDPANNPGARSAHCKWKDSSGNLYMFGGFYLGTQFFNDTWKFNPNTIEWTWVNGNNFSGSGFSGAYCITDTINLPVGRWENSSCWNDNCDNFWMYGGTGGNELWHFSPVLNQWTLVSGSNQSSGTTVYGTLGLPDPANHPGVRYGAVSWIDSTSNLWMFGGSASGGFANDVWRFSIDTICPAFSSCLQIPAAMLQSSDTLFCGKQSIDFYDLSTNNPTSWMWYFNGAVPDTSTSQNPTGIYYGNYGTFDVALKACNANGCDSIFLPGFISVYPTPVVPTITQSNDTLFCSPAFSYAWYESANASLILSTDSFYVFTQNGSYYVIISDSNGCEVAGNLVVIDTGVEQFLFVDYGWVSFYPNPASDRINFYFSELNVNAQMQITNFLGVDVYKTTTNKQQVTIDISSLAEGIYFLQVSEGKRKLIKKFAVSR